MEAVTHVSKDPQALWAGNQAVSVEIAGCCFMVKQTKLLSGQGTWAIFLIAANTMSELADLVGTNIYLTPGSVRSPVFRSPFPEDTRAFWIQERIWTFLDDFFLREGIKPVPVLMPEGGFLGGLSGAIEWSDSLLELLRGNHGWYSFDETNPRAMWIVDTVMDNGREVVVVELATVDSGHSLAGYCKEGTRIPLDVLTRAFNYSFRGPRAQDMEEIWLYFLELVTNHCDADRRHTD